MESFNDPLRGLTDLGRPGGQLGAVVRGRFRYETNNHCHRQRLVAGSVLGWGIGGGFIPTVDDQAQALALDLCTEDLPRNAIELAAARDALLVG